MKSVVDFPSIKMDINYFKMSWFLSIISLVIQVSLGKEFAVEVKVKYENERAIELNVRGDDTDLKSRMNCLCDEHGFRGIYCPSARDLLLSTIYS